MDIAPHRLRAAYRSGLLKPSDVVAHVLSRLRDPDQSGVLLQAMSEEQLDGIINIFRATQGLRPEPPPLGNCTLAQIREHYADFYKSLSAEKRAQAQRPNEEM